LKYWHLKIQRPIGVEEIIDLREKSRIYAGDDPSNDVCLNSIAVPSKHPLVQMRRGRPLISLSNEVVDSLRGSVNKKKNWKDKLYQGKSYEAQGSAEWNIEGVKFVLEQVDTLKLSHSSRDEDPLERKHFFQSISTSVGSHLLMALLIIGFTFLVQLLKTEQKPIEVQKFSVAQIEDVFKPKEEILKLPEPEEVKPVDTAVEPEKKLPQVAKKESAPAQLKKVSRAKKEAIAAAKGAPKQAKKDLSSMGLLAVQSVKTQANRNVSLKAPKVYSPQATVADANGGSFSTIGEGIRAGTQTASVAKLDGISSAGSYSNGEIGKQVSADAGPSIQLVRKEIEIKGGLDAAVVRQIIEERLAEVQYCYENVLLKKSNLSGKIETSWTITSDGSVSQMQSSSNDIKEKDLHDCVRGRISAWKFPNPKGGGVVHVKYPFVFRSLGG